MEQENPVKILTPGGLSNICATVSHRAEQRKLNGNVKKFEQVEIYNTWDIV